MQERVYTWALRVGFALVAGLTLYLVAFRN
jgi:hypothetical protein